MPGMVRVPKIESIKQEQKRFLRDFDRQVAEIERNRAEDTSKAETTKDDDSHA